MRLVLSLLAVSSLAHAAPLACDDPQLADVVAPVLARAASDGSTAEVIARALRSGSNESYLKCTAGHFPDAGVALDARYDHAGYVFVVDAQKKIAARGKLEGKSGASSTVDSFGVVDLDHDGHDELLETSAWEYHGITQRTYRVLGVAGHDVDELLSVPLLYDGDGGSPHQKASVDLHPVGDGTTELVVRRLELRGKIDKSVALPAAPVTYRLHGGKLAPR